MNVMDSECSSGCESGWTLYLEHSFLSSNAAAAAHRNTKSVGGKGGGFCEEKFIGKNQNDDDDDEEEDLSMVSDASSGPPHFHEDQQEGYFNDINGYQYPAYRAATITIADNGGKRQKRKEHRRRGKEKVLPSFLDDTASSPVFNFSSSKNDFALTNNNQASMESALDYSQAFSATPFQGRSAFQDHYVFSQPSSLSGNHLQNNQF